ncbi:MAG: hypothetical protein ABIM99_00025 [Candidatus Dojkabacteria bacterium]
MPIKFDYYVPKIFSLILILVASVAFTLLVNFNALEIVNRPVRNITAQTFDEDIKTLSNDDIVSFNGTINYLRVISDSGENTYYVGFEEFGDKLIVRMSRQDFEGSSLKNVQGNIKFLDNSSFSDSLISKLNEKGTLDDVNQSDLNQLDTAVKERIADSLQGNFSNGSVLVVEGQKFERQKIYLETLLLGVFSTIFLIILLRNKVLYS